MNREILFKAKRLVDGGWAYGDLSQHKTGKKFIKAGSATHSFEVDADTICQYTGLTDKNGNKIWENDLIECKEFSKGCLIKHFLSQVEWDADGTGFTFKDSKFGWAFMDSLAVYECQVIGNIFDNPELLKEGEKE